MSEHPKKSQQEIIPKSEELKVQERLSPSEVSIELKQHQANLAEFLLGLESLSLSDKQKYLEEAEKWEENQDLDLLRSAGLSLEQIKNDPLARSQKLSALYLKRNSEAAVNLKNLRFDVDFQENQLAEWGLDLTDLLPANVLKIDVYDHEGKIVFENAIRGKNGNQIGYFEEKSGEQGQGRQAKVQTGFSVVIKETQSNKALYDAKFGRQTHKNLLADSMFLTQNAAKTEVKDYLRVEADKQGKTLVTGADFFDKLLVGVLSLFNSKSWQKFNQEGKFDFSDLNKTFRNDFMKIIEQSSYSKDLNAKNIDSTLKNLEMQKRANPQDSPATASEDSRPDQELIPLSLELNLSPFRKKTVEAARSFVGDTRFRGREVAGGALACAQVVSTILKSIGAIDKVILGVDNTEQELLRKGWKKHLGPPQAGDVVIWGRTPSRIKDGISVPGHKHIGVMTTDQHVVNNNSALRHPIEAKLNFKTPRGLHYLRPPENFV